MLEVGQQEQGLCGRTAILRNINLQEKQSRNVLVLSMSTMLQHTTLVVLSSDHHGLAVLQRLIWGHL